MLTQEQSAAIAEYVNTHNLSRGVGSRESACSIAAINLALTGELTDHIPACMSPVIGRWIIRTQDAMPAAMRNSTEWKSLLPRAAGTGREREQERRALTLDWMWVTVLPQLQPIADKHGFGAPWQAMLADKTAESARTARDAADAAYAAYAAAAYAAYADAAAAAAAAAYAAAAAAAAAADARLQFWQAVNPCALLRRLIDLA